MEKLKDSNNKNVDTAEKHKTELEENKAELKKYKELLADIKKHPQYTEIMTKIAKQLKYYSSKMVRAQRQLAASKKLVSENKNDYMLKTACNAQNKKLRAAVVAYRTQLDRLKNSPEAKACLKMFSR